MQKRSLFGVFRPKIADVHVSDKWYIETRFTRFGVKQNNQKHKKTCSHTRTHARTHAYTYQQQLTKTLLFTKKSVLFTLSSQHRPSLSLPRTEGVADYFLHGLGKQSLFLIKLGDASEECCLPPVQRTYRWLIDTDLGVSFTGHRGRICNAIADCSYIRSCDQIWRLWLTSTCLCPKLWKIYYGASSDRKWCFVSETVKGHNYYCLPSDCKWCFVSKTVKGHNYNCLPSDRK